MTSRRKLSVLGRRGLSLFLSITMMFSLIQVNVLARPGDQWRPGDNDQSGSDDSVDHIDIGIKLTADIMINGVLYEDQSYTLSRSDISSSKLTITAKQESTGEAVTCTPNWNDIETSDGASGMDQFRIGGDYPVGSIDDQVIYTLVLNKVVEVRISATETVEVPVTFTTSFGYWDSDNDCPGIRNDKKDDWQDGEIIGGSGLDFVLGNGEGKTEDEDEKPTHGMINIIKNVSGLDEAADFEFEIYSEDGELFDTITAADVASTGMTSIDRVPFGTYYIVEKDASIDGYTLVTTFTVGNGEAQEECDDVILSEDSTEAYVYVNNTYEEELPPEPTTGSLTIDKSIVGLETAPNGLSFTVAGPNEYSETFEYTGKKIVIDDLDPGIYTVSENGAEVDGYDLTVTGTFEGEVAAGEDLELSIVNTYEEKLPPPPTTGALIVNKTIIGLENAPSGLSFTITGPNGYSNTISYASFENGAYAIEDLEPGEYTVIENGAEIDGYILEVTGSKTANVTAGNVSDISITNTYTELPPPPAKGELKLTKTFEGDSVAIPEDLSFTVIGPEGYSVTIKYADFENGVYLLEELEPGKYTVVENNGKVDGYDLSVTGNETEITVIAGEEAEMAIVNTYERQLGSLFITKAFEGDTVAVPEGLSFTITGPEGFSKTVAYSEFQSGSYLLENLVPGNYKVAENGGKIDGYDLTVAGDGEITVSAKNESEMKIVNKYERQLGSLTITKTFEGDAVTVPSTLSFTVTNTDGYSKVVLYSDFENGSYTIENLVPGTYTVSESGADVEGFALDVTGTGNVEVIAKSNASLAVVNTYDELLGSLKITKSFAGDDVSIPTGITFTVAGPNGYSKTVAYSEFENGVYVLENLKPGTYTVTEAGAGVEGYELTTEGTGELTVKANSEASANITNTYTEIILPPPPAGDLKIIKTFAGDEVTVPASLSFTVTGPNGFSKTVYYSEFQDGIFVIEGLEPGTYTVAENGGTVEGFALVTEGEGEYTVAADEITAVNMTNTYDELLCSLKITKIFAGDEVTAPEALSFTVAGPNGYSKTFAFSEFIDGTLTVEGLKPGTYTVTEAGTDVEGFTVEVSGEGSVDVTANEISGLEITNTYTKKAAPPSDPEGDLKIVKKVIGAEMPEDAEFEIIKNGRIVKTIKYSQFKNGSYTIRNLSTGTYTIRETGADVEGYELTVDVSDEEFKIRKDQTTTVTIVNEYVSLETPEIPEVPEMPEVPMDPPTPEVPGVPETPDVNIPQTGDSMMFWAMTALISGLALVWLAIDERKYGKNKA